jgi:HSP20 family protein
MAVSDILPWKRDGDKIANRRREEDPIFSLQREMNRMFDDFFTKPYGMEPFSAFNEMQSGFMPRIDVSETDKEIRVTADLPGLDEKDIQLTLENEILIISGKKETEKEEKGRQFHRVERTYGSFRREIPLPSHVEADKVEATFKKGVLTVTVQKDAMHAPSGKRVPIKTQ